jgi:hypothetical protein
MVFDENFINHMLLALF